MDLEKELERANCELDEQLARSNCITRWIAKTIIESKYRDNVKRGIIYGTDALHDILQKL